MAVMEGPPRLRPMDLGDLLDQALALYRSNFTLFAGIAAVLGVPQAILNVIVTAVTPSNFGMTTSEGTTNVDAGALGTAAGLLSVNGIIGFIFSTLITGALVQAIAHRYLDRPITIGSAYTSVGLGTYVMLGVVSILSVLAIVFGLILLVIPGVLFAVWWSFLAQVIVLERLGFGSFGRSRQLVSGYWWRTFGIRVVLYLLVAILTSVATGVGAAIFAALGEPGRLLGTALGQVANIIVLPFKIGVLTLLYFDLRIRKEGFDLEQMALHLDDPRPA